MEVEARGLAADEGTTEAELATGESFSHYRIIAQLGAGGMGQVYLAQDMTLGRNVALKLLPPDFTRDKHRVRRFQQEARAASALNHPNIITIHEIGQAEERHFIATEFIDGETLRQHVRGPQSQTTSDSSRTLATLIHETTQSSTKCPFFELFRVIRWIVLLLLPAPFRQRLPIPCGLHYHFTIVSRSFELFG